MLKTINIDFYIDGYNVSHINCLDLVTAAASGFCKRENYFLYCFYRSLMSHWANVRDLKFLQQQNQILHKLGLAIEPQQVTDNHQLIQSIRQLIEDQTPPILLVKYNKLFYDVHYHDPNYQGDHAILVSGFDTQAPVIAIREFVHIRNFIRKLTRADVFGILNLDEQLLADIWEKSNQSFGKTDSEHYNTIYCIKRTASPLINNYQDLINDFIHNYRPDRNRLIEVVTHLAEWGEVFESPGKSEQFRREFYGSLTILFDVLERALPVLNADQECRVRFDQFKEKYSGFRNKLLNRLMARGLSKQTISADEEQELTRNLVGHDRELLLLMEELFDRSAAQNLYQSPDCDLQGETGGNWPGQSNLVNYALGMEAKADSEYRPAKQAVNGRMESTADSWRSLDSPDPHWLAVDLGQSRTVARVVVKHFLNNPGCVTRDFIIQGSGDGVQWADLASVANNSALETVHHLAPAAFRYFRLFITVPSLNDNIARIYEFELWGELTPDAAKN